MSNDPDPREVKAKPGTFRLEEAIGAAAMGLIALISISNVVVRYATDVSFAFTEEYSVFLLVVVTFVGAALAFATNDHIRITYLADRSGRVGRVIARVISLGASVLMFSLLVYYGADLALDEYIYEETTPGLGYPTWIYTMWLPLLSLAILARILQQVWYALRSAP